jgi:hypothetical protein
LSKNSPHIKYNIIDNMKIKSLLIAIALTACSSAVTLNVGTGFGTGVGIIAQTSNGTDLTSGGYYIGLGTFASAPATGTQSQLISAVGGFQELTSATSPTSGGTQGKIAGSFVSINTDFNSKPIYFLIGNAATKAASTEFAIFTMSPATSFPAAMGGSGATAITVGNINQINTFAGAGTEIDSASGVSDRVKLASVVVIPETSTSLLGALGALALLRRRRN